MVQVGSAALSKWKVACSIPGDQTLFTPSARGKRPSLRVWPPTLNKIPLTLIYIQLTVCQNAPADRSKRIQSSKKQAQAGSSSWWLDRNQTSDKRTRPEQIWTHKQTDLFLFLFMQIITYNTCKHTARNSLNLKFEIGNSSSFHTRLHWLDHNEWIEEEQLLCWEFKLNNKAKVFVRFEPSRSPNHHLRMVRWCRYPTNKLGSRLWGD